VWQPDVLLRDLMLYFASRDLHLSATFARRFYWSDMNLWPEDMPPGSVVLLVGGPGTLWGGLACGSGAHTCRCRPAETSQVM
jgi:hypothetical protein